MTLIVEDGSIVANANSYADLDYIKAYALARGATLSIDDAVIEQQVAIAMDYIEGKRNEYQGIKVDSTQSLQFPRDYLIIDGFDFDSTSIPKELKNALSQLIIEQTNGIDILPTSDEPAIKKETVGPISTEYAVNIGSIIKPSIPAVDLLLAPLLKNVSTSGFALTTIRV